MYYPLKSMTYTCWLSIFFSAITVISNRWMSLPSGKPQRFDPLVFTYVLSSGILYHRTSCPWEKYLQWCHDNSSRTSVSSHDYMAESLRTTSSIGIILRSRSEAVRRNRWVGISTFNKRILQIVLCRLKTELQRFALGRIDLIQSREHSI